MINRFAKIAWFFGEFAIRSMRVCTNCMGKNGPCLNLQRISGGFMRKFEARKCWRFGTAEKMS